MSNLECCRVLKVALDASESEIKNAYRKLVRRLHPDVRGGSSEEFHRMTLAYEVLMRQMRQRRAVTAFSLDQVRRWGSCLLETPDADKRVIAAANLGKTGRSLAWTYLRTAFTDANPKVVEAAVRAAGQLRLVSSIPELEALYPRSGAKVRMAILDAAREIGGPRALALLKTSQS